MRPPTTTPKRHGFRSLLFAVPVPSGPGMVPSPSHGPAPAPTAVPVDELAAPPARGGSGESHVRLRAMPLGEITWLDANVFLDEIAEEQLQLATSLAALERSVAPAPRDASARAALEILARRVRGVGQMRDVLASLHAATVDPRLHRVLLPDAPLSEYVRGIYAWLHAVVRALADLEGGLRALQPDWAQLRYRLEEAKMFHFDELEDAIAADLLALDIVTLGGTSDLERVVVALLAAAGELESALDERFG